MTFSPKQVPVLIKPCLPRAGQSEAGGLETQRAQDAAETRQALTDLSSTCPFCQGCLGGAPGHKRGVPLSERAAYGAHLSDFLLYFNLNQWLSSFSVYIVTWSLC